MSPLAATARRMAARPAHEGMVRFIDEKGTNHGVIPIERALEAAAKAEMELLQLKPADPEQKELHKAVPICKLMDVAKYKYDLDKKASKAQQQSRLHAKQNTLKELKFGTNIEANDLEFKVSRAKQFIEKGFQVRITIVLRRSAKIPPNMRKQRAFEILNEVTSSFSGVAKESANERKVMGGSVRTTFTPL
ncbi:Translation initiation factor IF-3, chloroplastic [Hondaea fermentalgiana]|uniref:Translation initiation factor IF-3, chloroplastic n=1 Tax=Hondaea fermentalgiana TaxID=2315210 RepID=A0A2R5GAV7_9STRA|nr:Translation initiation factor IF-3, chloroplastic [Hondaea fermentalgiana]|eukprot:GBG28156.1 Translation initiation factor IF-3, chloroplastic [Hondaea fermentalgiana]